MTETTRISPTLIVLSGLPGSGKTVLAEGLSRALSIPIFAIDTIETAMARAGLDKAETSTAAYEVARALADEHLRLRHSVIVDAVNPAETPRAGWRNHPRTPACSHSACTKTPSTSGRSCERARAVTY